MFYFNDERVARQQASWHELLITGPFGNNFQYVNVDDKNI